MKKKMPLFILAVLFGSVAAQAGEKSYQRGVLLQMDSESCGFAEKGGKTIAGTVLGTDGEHKKTQQVLCQEYSLQSDRIVYRIRPKDDKHPVLLPVGDTAEFRIHKDKMLLRVREMDDKEREYIVVAMTPRSDVNADNRAAKDAKPPR